MILTFLILVKKICHHYSMETKEFISPKYKNVSDSMSCGVNCCFKLWFKKKTTTTKDLIARKDVFIFQNRCLTK